LVEQSDGGFAPSGRLFSASLGFFEVARAAHRSDGMFHWPAFYVNICYSIELSLKAFLVQRGASKSSIRHQVGHRLGVALNMAVSAGYRPPDDHLRVLIGMIGSHHQDHSLRYLEGDVQVHAPAPEETLRAVADHLDAIGAQLPVSNLRGMN
jgi:hypothetical protein